MNKDIQKKKTALQRSAKVDAPGLVNFVLGVAYHFCLSLPAEFTQLAKCLLTLADLYITHPATSHSNICPRFHV